jgi:2-(3-amino-3-carboxypropyl)histidine synthase
MESDRAETDLGIAADLEQAAEDAAPVQRQPKKRFIGRRQAAENALKGGEDSSAIEDSGAIQGT